MALLFWVPAYPGNAKLGKTKNNCAKNSKYVKKMNNEMSAGRDK